MVATAQPDKLWDPIAARWAPTHGAAILSESSRQGRALSEALPATSSSTARAVSLSLAVHRQSGNLTASDAAHQIPMHKAHALLACRQQ